MRAVCAVLALAFAACGVSRAEHDRLVQEALAHQRGVCEEEKKLAVEAATGVKTVPSERGMCVEELKALVPATSTVAPGQRLTSTEITTIMQSQKTDVRRCYDRELVLQPDLEGKLVVSLRVADNGLIDAACIKSTTFVTGDIEQCILRTVRSLKFPKPRGGGSVVVSYPYVFQSGSKPKTAPPPAAPPAKP
jgi:hypothetical protein